MKQCPSSRRGAVRQIAMGLVLVSVVAAQSRAQAPVSDSLRIARLAAVGRLWGVVRYFHPALGDRDGGWDASTAVAIERVQAARTTDEYIAVVSTLLATLHDPATRVQLMRPPAQSPIGAHGVTTRWDVTGVDSTLILAIPAFDSAATSGLRRAAPEVRRARRVVFDLRGPRPSDDGAAYGVFANAGMDVLLPATPAAFPAVRQRIHSGFPTQVGAGASYWPGVVEIPPGGFPSQPGAVRRRIVFLVSASSGIPPIAFALHSNGQGAVVVDGDGPQLEAGADELYSVPLGEGVTAVVRTEDLAGWSPDTVLQRSQSGDAPLQAALALAHRPIAPPLIPLRQEHDDIDSLPSAPYPTAGYRVLAAYQWWNAIHYFYPYKALIGEDWDALLPLSIARCEAARDSLEYAQDIAEMVTHIHDSHGTVIERGAALKEYYGLGFVGAQLQYIAGVPVVISVVDDSATRASGIVVGDVIVKVDGEDATAKRARLARYIAYSTPQALDNSVARLLLRGSVGAARLTVRDANNQLRERSVPRTATMTQRLRYPRTGPILQLLPGNVGYADLARLPVSMVDSMFNMFKNTSAIIFDDRGYPQGRTDQAIAPRLTDKEAVPVALIERPLVMSPDATRWATDAHLVHTMTTSKPRYHGKTVLLVDERTGSLAEHLGLSFIAVNHTTIVGSTTSGLDGDQTAVAFAGGIAATFTGQGVRHADGRQLQRVGLKPDITVRPTLKGIRAGRDEVLDRALALLHGSKR